MEGATLRDEQEHDRFTALAWNTAMFALNGYGGKLKGKSLSDYLIKKPEKRTTTAQAIAFFHSMKTAGLPVTITRVERSGSPQQ